jgi:hypothetical protein
MLRPLIAPLSCFYQHMRMSKQKSSATRHTTSWQLLNSSVSTTGPLYLMPLRNFHFARAITLSVLSAIASQRHSDSIKDLRNAIFFLIFSSIFPAYPHDPTPHQQPAQGLRNNLTDACERHDPCQHGGICISTDSGPICECRNMEYEGPYCEKGENFVVSFHFYFPE